VRRMPVPSFDAIIVGARCAGAALAQRLAAAGLSVALVDAADLPSDHSCSTHLIQPPGMDELDELGVGGSVRRLAPAIETVRLRFDDSEARLPYGEGRAAHCLRRKALDALLLEAAVKAGAELRTRTRVTGVVRAADERVRGVEIRHGGQGREQLYADLVVGADGRNSTLASLVGAGEYLGYDGARAAYWAYWRRPPGWNPSELLNSFEGEDARVVFPTDGDLLLIATTPPLDRARSWRGRHRDAYLANLRSHEPIGSLLGDAAPVSKVRGVLKTRYFFRTSAGPGWALLGDAGHHKEFIVGLGITDALRDARELSGAILEREPAALQRWWRGRDAERIEMFFWSRDLGRAEAVNPLQRLSAAGLADATGLQGRFAEIIDGRRSPYDLIPAAHALRWIGKGLLRGEGGLIAPLIRTVLRRMRARLELRLRERLRSSQAPWSPGERPRSCSPRRLCSLSCRRTTWSSSSRLRCRATGPRARWCSAKATPARRAM
jgi:flavin-dependent dehydrogenase